jgi:hypothetical protein
MSRAARFDTGFSGRVRGGRRKRVLLVVIAVVLSMVGMAFAIGATSGFDWLWRFFTVPSLEAHSGKKYTPTGAVKRYFEKLEERGAEE